jgi:alkylresorcinol/alkylpyrone synthase
MAVPVSLLALATAVPPHAIAQADIEQRARRLFADLFARFPQLDEVFANAGVERHYAARPVEWYEDEHDIGERTEAYFDAAGDLFVAAAEKALVRAGLEARDVDIVVNVSSTGIATPSLEARVAQRLGLRSDAMRVPIFGLGCAGGVTGLAIAARLARAEPGRNVLLVAHELCTLAFRGDRGDKADVVAAALFGDGAAAAVLRADKGRAGLARIGTGAEHTWPRTLDIMGWSLDPAGFGVILSRALPRFIERRFAAPARKFLEATGLHNMQPRFVCHLGSAKVLAAIEAAVGLDEGALADERAILRDYANMSSPSILFVLERALALGLAGPIVLAGMGPGFTASFLAAEAGRG